MWTSTSRLRIENDYKSNKIRSGTLEINLGRVYLELVPTFGSIVALKQTNLHVVR